MLRKLAMRLVRAAYSAGFSSLSRSISSRHPPAPRWISTVFVTVSCTVFVTTVVTVFTRVLDSAILALRADALRRSPPDGAAWRARLAGRLAEDKAALLTSPEARKAADYFSAIPPDEIDDEIDRAQVRLFLSEYSRTAGVPAELLREHSCLKGPVAAAWREAKAKKDYRIFAPWLAKAFDIRARMARAVAPDRPVFETIVGQTDEGFSLGEISSELEKLRNGVATLLKKIPPCETPDFMRDEYDPDAVTEFGKKLAYFNGLDETCVTFNDRGVHGLTNRPGPRDARISWARSARLDVLFTLMHEGGHAMYSTRTDERLAAAGLWGGVTGAENIVGRSREYWQWHYPELQKALPGLNGVSRDEFYEGINAVRPSARRISADEVTYSLHIIVRFELEKAFFDGDLKAADLRDAWNEKYRALLGVTPRDDAEGILQDMHWAGDYIGYFQSYALGNIIGGQLRSALLRDVPNAFANLSGGDIAPLDAWMQEKVFRHGRALSAPELLKRAAGATLDAGAFLDYLNAKFATR